MLYPAINRSRSYLSLDGIWEFRFSDEENWRSIYVPASFNNQFTDPKARSYSGIVEYRRRFTIPSWFSGSRTVLRFDAVTHNATVFIDKKKVCNHTGGFLPFEIELNDYVEFGNEHELLVLVDNRINLSTLPIGNESSTAFFGSDNPGIPSVEHGKAKLSAMNFPNFDFYNYAGITRHVRIYTTPMSYIADINVVSSINDNNGVINFSIQCKGEGSIEVEVKDAEGYVVFNSKAAEGKACIPDAHFWEPWPGCPYLYTLCVSFKDDYYELPFGIRTVEVIGHKLLLNGQPIYLKGVGKHEDSFIRGRGIDECLNLKDIGLLHWLGANSFRTSHYPYAEEMYQLCDRQGIMIIDELPAVGLNFQGKINPYDLGIYENHLHLLKELINRDKNHPSVVIWSLGNEPDTEHFPEDALSYWSSLYYQAHSIDPDNRPVTVVCCQNDYTKDITAKSMDIVCINRYYGWYNLSGSLSVASEALEEELNYWKTIDKPLLPSEYGADAISGMHAIIPEMFTEEFQVEYLESMNRVLDKFEFIVGEHPWNFADFDTIQGPMRAGGNHKGLFTRERNPKMAAHSMRKRWKNI